MPDEKDRLGDKLQNLEKAREDQWAAQRDRELLEKLQRKQAKTKPAIALCPRCQKQLTHTKRAGVSMLTCPAGDGAWIEKSALEELLRTHE